MLFKYGDKTQEIFGVRIYCEDFVDLFKCHAANWDFYRATGFTLSHSNVLNMEWYKKQMRVAEIDLEDWPLYCSTFMGTIHQMWLKGMLPNSHDGCYTSSPTPAFTMDTEDKRLYLNYLILNTDDLQNFRAYFQFLFNEVTTQSVEHFISLLLTDYLLKLDISDSFKNFIRKSLVLIELSKKFATLSDKSILNLRLLKKELAHDSERA